MWPHEFRVLWEIEQYGPLTAGEIAASLNRPIRTYGHYSSVAVSNQLRGLVRRGFLAGDGGRPQIYRLTDRGKEFVDA